MDNLRLKLKLGEHEFEAEGPPEAVQSQFAAFRQLVRPADEAQTTPASPPPPQVESPMRLEGNVVCLTRRGASLDDEILLLLLGQKLLRNNDAVSGSEITAGLNLSGRRVRRVDYHTNKMTDAGYVITLGTRRARRYRLTNQGLVKGQQLADELGNRSRTGCNADGIGG